MLTRLLRCLGPALLLGSAPLQSQAVPAPVRVVVHTSLGDIHLAIDSASAPVTAANFLAYVDQGHYAAARFHRTVTMHNQESSPVKIEVIQASVAPAMEPRDHPPIPLERTARTGLRHRNGTVSMARGGPDSATSSFFICIGDQPELDFGGKRNPDGQGFAAFGTVLSGMDVVRAIHASPARGQALEPPVPILGIERER